MVDQFKQFIDVFKALGQQKVDYVLIGGVAVILHGMDLKKLIEAGKINKPGPG